MHCCIMLVAGEARAPAAKDKNPSGLGSCLFENSNGRAGIGHLFLFFSCSINSGSVLGFLRGGRRAGPY